MTAKENMNTVRKLYDLYNTNDPSKLNNWDNLFSGNVAFHDPSSPQAKKGTQAIKQAETSYINAFPNKNTTIDSMMATDDNQVIVRWHSTGTQKGPFHGVQPTNKNFNISGISIYQMENGKISEIWQNWDEFGLMQQLSPQQNPKIPR